MAEWEIKKPLGHCCGTGEEIAESQEYYAALVDTPEGLERQDFSLEYWNEHQPKVYCFWKTRRTPEAEKKKLFVDDDMLLAFFERLADENDPEKVNFRFVLTLILMRKRILRYESSKIENGTEIWSLKMRGRDELQKVINPQLEEEQIEELSGQVGQILQVDLEE